MTLDPLIWSLLTWANLAPLVILCLLASGLTWAGLTIVLPKMLFREQPQRYMIGSRGASMCVPAGEPRVLKPVVLWEGGVRGSAKIKYHGEVPLSHAKTAYMWKPLQGGPISLDDMGDTHLRRVTHMVRKRLTKFHGPLDEEFLGAIIAERRSRGIDFCDHCYHEMFSEGDPPSDEYCACDKEATYG